MGLFGKLKKSLSKTRTRLFGGLKSVLTLGRAIDEKLLEEVEEILLLADVGPGTTDTLVEELRQAWKKGKVRDAAELQPVLQTLIAERLSMGGTDLRRAAEGPTVVLVCGVNGAGKTTSIGKLTQFLRREGHSVLLGAADTFRAARRRAAHHLERAQWGGDCEAVHGCGPCGRGL